MKKLIGNMLFAVATVVTGTAALVTAGIFLAGCQQQQPPDGLEQWNEKGRIVWMVEINEHFDILCDKSTNIAYLRYWAHSRAGITPYLNSEGQPSRCNEVHR